MPSTTFPRTAYVMQVLRNVTAPSVPGPLISVSQSGLIRTRELATAGNSWREEYGQLAFRNSDTQDFVSYINWAWKNGIKFFIDHPTTPGSGEPHLGVAASGLSITVSGGSQSGDGLVTTGWPNSTNNLLLPGTVISVAGINRVFRVVDPVSSNSSGVATIKIDPPIYVGGSPVNGSAVTYNNVKYRAIIFNQPSMPEIGNAFYYDGLSVEFTEAV